MPIYTKKGDKGTTGLFGSQERVSKSDRLFSVIGTLDEANSHLGLAVALLEKEMPHANIIRNKLEQVQKSLFDLGAILAGAKISFSSSRVLKYEKEIDIWIKTMPARQNFILPGGTPAAAELFVARSVVRRLERNLVALSKSHMVKPGLLKYINRLSDYLYALARYINYLSGREETIWKR